MRIFFALLWLLVVLIIGALVWLALFSIIFFPLIRVMPASDTILISLALLTLLLGLPAFLSAAASTRVWRKQFCRFGSWVGIIPPLALTLALVLGFNVLSRWQAVFAVMLSFLIGLVTASYTNRVCSLNNKPESNNG